MMDSRFSENYDPSNEMQLTSLLQDHHHNDDDDDGQAPDSGRGDNNNNGKKKEEEEGSGNWDEAIEAYRDRQKWKQQGADRLRAAGFTEEQVAKWERQGPGGAQRDADDVRWSGRGEKREWDRGKEVEMAEVEGDE